MLNCQRVHQLLTESGLARRQFPSRSPIILHWVDTTSFEGLPEGINVKSWKPLGSPSERTRWTHGPRLQTHSSGVWTKNTVSPSDKPWEATVGTTNLTSAKKKNLHKSSKIILEGLQPEKNQRNLIRKSLRSGPASLRLTFSSRTCSVGHYMWSPKWKNSKKVVLSFNKWITDLYHSPPDVHHF